MSRAKRMRKPSARRSARKISRPARSRRKPAVARSTAARPASARSTAAARPASARSAAAARPATRLAAGWSTLQVVWRPALAMATLPVRVYRVYRWAEAEQARAASV